MAVGTLCFLTIPAPMLRVFTKDAQVVEIGRVSFHFVGVLYYRHFLKRTYGKWAEG